MNIRSATEDYERWLGRHVALVPRDLRLKHAAMISPKSPFPFFRATFYRWVQRLPEVCPAVMDAPTVLAVGDLHVNNFGTWRDADGRLAWGVNDFDEAFELPYTNDLARLAASAILACRDSRLGLDERELCAAIAQGYADGIAERLGGTAEPIISDEKHRWLALAALGRDPVRFWSGLRGLPPRVGAVPAVALEAIRGVLPEPRPTCRITARPAGMGSLGRPRFCAVAQWEGGPIAREAKALAPSACVWAGYKGPARRSRVPEAVEGAVRARDPFLRVVKGWMARRLAPDCGKITLEEVSGVGKDQRLLHLMGVATAHAHSGERVRLRAVRRDLSDRPSRWLRDAAVAMSAAVLEDWQRFRSAPSA